MDSVNRLVLERAVNAWKSFRHNSVEIYGGSYNAMSGLNFMIDYGDGLLSGNIAIPEGLPPLFTVKQYFQVTGRDSESIRIVVQQGLSPMCKFYDIPIHKRIGVNHYPYAVIPIIESRILLSKKLNKTQQEVY